MDVENKICKEALSCGCRFCVSKFCGYVVRKTTYGSAKPKTFRTFPAKMAPNPLVFSDSDVQLPPQTEDTVVDHFNVSGRHPSNLTPHRLLVTWGFDARDNPILGCKRGTPVIENPPRIAAARPRPECQNAWKCCLCYTW